MLKDESNTIKNNTNFNTASAKLAQLNDPQQTAKERTLFCVNINEKCSEDILYELFLQAGPIENIVRKADKNGTLICLITYKHIQSCEYAISLFNGIRLFDKELKVKQSDASLAISKDNQNTSRYMQLYSNNNSQPRDSRAYNNNRLSMDGPYQQKMSSQPTTPQSLMLPPQFSGSLLAQAFSGLSPSFADFGQAHQLNRSWSGNDNDFHSSSRRNSNNFDFNNRGNNQSRRSNDFSHNRNNNNNNNEYSRDHSNKHHYHDQSRSRDRRSDYQNDRSRSRSPARKRNRR